IGFEETDDAFLAANVYQVSARVAGRLVEVPVKQNQLVSAGELLAEVASDDYAARVAEKRAALELAQAETRKATIAVGVVDVATLELSYTRIVAPAAGRVTNKAALAGDYAAPGRVLMAIVSPDVWVVANFKETQLERLRPGQKASVHLDAYDLDLAAHVDSVQSGSGAPFRLLPPPNATGNYVKVVQ